MLNQTKCALESMKVFTASVLSPSRLRQFISARCCLSWSWAAWSIRRVTCRGRCGSNYTVVLRLSGCNKEEIIKGGGFWWTKGAFSASGNRSSCCTIARLPALELFKYCPNPSCNGKCKLLLHANNCFTIMFRPAISNSILIQRCSWLAGFLCHSFCFSHTRKGRFNSKTNDVSVEIFGFSMFGDLMLNSR